METLVLTITVSEPWRELLVAELDERGFEAFEETDAGVVAYAPAVRWTSETQAAIRAWLDARGLGAAAFEERRVAAQNWNAQWEASIQPIVAGPFVVAPTWAAPGPDHAGRTVLTIDPKMSFGTGHHASTRLALGLLAPLVGGGERVLDAGTGTGVLAIAALKLGAAGAIGFDVDEWAVPNAEENARLNDVADRFEVREGDIEAVPERGFDLLLANIQLDVLTVLVPTLVPKGAPGFRLVLAGLLRTDADAMRHTLDAHGLVVLDSAAEDEWWACVAHVVA